MGVLLVVAFFACACISFQREIRVTPEAVPAELVGASWDDFPVEYCVVSQGEGGFVEHETFAGLVQQAMAAWGVETSFGGDCEGPLTEGNGVNEIGWGTLSGIPGQMHEAGESSIRYRSSLLGGGPPAIVEADVRIDRDPADGRDTVECLYTTLLHEAGHMFGVPHLEVSTVMSPVITDCLQELTPADRAALAELY
jgi:hypothetical protein